MKKNKKKKKKFKKPKSVIRNGVAYPASQADLPYVLGSNKFSKSNVLDWVERM